MNKIKYADWNSDRRAQFLSGTALSGAGIALLAILNDQVRSNRRKMRAIANKGDTITLNLGAPAAVKEAAVGDLLLGAGVGLGSYYALNKLYKMLRSKQLLEELQAANTDYIGTLQDSTMKKAFLSLSDLASLPPDLMLASALAAGAGTYGLLSNTFPQVKDKKEPVKPKRIVVKGYGTVIPDGPGDGPLADIDKKKGKQVVAEQSPEPILAQQSAERPEAEKEVPEYRKLAFATPYGPEDELNAARMLAYLMVEQPQVKMARSLLPSLLGAIHQNEPQVVTLWKEAGEGMFSTLKDADGIFYDLAPHDKRAAIHRAFSNPATRSLAALMTHCEFRDVMPDMAKRASVIHDDEGYGPVLIKMASLMWNVSALQTELSGVEKSAAADGMVSDARKELSTLGQLEASDAQGDVDDADRLYQAQKDPIDQFLLGKSVDATR